MPADLERARSHNQSRLNRIAAVKLGALETNAELLSGFDFAYESAERSCQSWITSTIEDLEHQIFETTDISKALAALYKRHDVTRLQRVLKAAEAMQWHDVAQRAMIYLIFAADNSVGRMRVDPVRSRVASMCMSSIRTESLDAPFFLATAVGLMTSSRSTSMAVARNTGFQSLGKITESADRLKDAAKAPNDEPDDEDYSLEDAVLDDRAEYYGQGTAESPLRIRIKQQRPGAVVLSKYPVPTTGKDDRGRSRREFESIAGRRLPLVLTGDVHQHMVELSGRSPHLAPIYEAMLSDTAMSQHVRLRPWLLVGPPGCGKTSLAIDLAQTLDLPFTVFDASSSADGTFGGSAAHWSTSGPCEPLRLIKETGVANPLVIVDEIEKAATSPANGGLQRALLAFLEPNNAAHYRDPSLELSVDLSNVNYVLTANSLEGIPAPLRDRCRIVQVPNPGFEHVGALVDRIIDDIARARNIDRRWMPPLAPDEIDVVKNSWGGGSIRRLAQVVQSALDFRSSHMGRC